MRLIIGLGNPGKKYEKTRHNIGFLVLEKYDDFRNENKTKFRKEIYRLSQEGIIRKYYQDKKWYLELSQKGKKKLKKYVTDQLEIKYPNKWDKKWRIVIFDVPDKKTNYIIY